ncbi:hypothetical protein QBC42DRAFT_263581 [Cladorrhinum samala]|uniref:Clr5 domain-containing protein n=1 Tax=Cladorrhinum samala TaxID=585594 RepID=A0AAV9HU02_9PEZI|nr:hypothetical protein QBC42DRAFT_263581 [Cladorrhinum samala]
MYKTRIKSWGLDKNFKESEVVELFRLRRERERAGKVKSTYMIRGREVDWDRVNSYIRRKGINISQLLITTPVGPSAREVSCVTPPPTIQVKGSSDSQDQPARPFTDPFANRQIGPAEPIRISSPSSSSEFGPNPSPSPSQGFTAPPFSSSILLTPISPNPLAGSNPGPRRLSHPPFPAPAALTQSSIAAPVGPPLIPASRFSSAPTSPSRLPTLVEFQSLLSALYATTMFQDGDKTWGTTEYWLRSTRSLEWFSTIRWKLSFLRHAAPREAPGKWKRFASFNRAFAMVEPLSTSIIGTRTWYIINFAAGFWEEQSEVVEKILGEVMRVCGHEVAVPSGITKGGGGEEEQLQVGKGEAQLLFVDGEAGYKESAERFLIAVLRRMVRILGVHNQGMEIGVLGLEEDAEGFPVLDGDDDDKKNNDSMGDDLMVEKELGQGWKERRKMSRQWSETCLISDPDPPLEMSAGVRTGGPGRGLVGMLEEGVRLLANRDESKAEELLRAVVEGAHRGSSGSSSSSSGGGGGAGGEKDKVLGRCASYHLSKIYGRRGQANLARECLIRGVENSLYFDKYVGWDEAEFLFA